MYTIPLDGGGKHQGINVQLNQIKVTDQQRYSTADTVGNTRSDVTCYNCQHP